MKTLQRCFILFVILGMALGSASDCLAVGDVKLVMVRPHNLSERRGDPQNGYHLGFGLDFGLDGSPLLRYWARRGVSNIQ